MYKLLLLIITIYVSSLSAQHRTPDYYKCSNRIGGSWIFGKAPYACDSSAFGDDLFAFQNYSDFIFSDQRLSSEERIAYMSRMHKAIQKKFFRGIYLKETPKSLQVNKLSGSKRSLQNFIKKAFGVIIVYPIKIF